MLYIYIYIYSSVLEKKEKKKKLPGEDSSTVTFVLPGPTGLLVSLPIGLHRVFLGAFIAFPFLLSMFSAIMLLDPGEVAQSACGAVVHACRLGADVDALSDLGRCSLPQLPWKVMAPSV